jgi:NAD(P)-dependent dehydrogenase (short-subunit alcohol dehydrogenase family)
LAVRRAEATEGCDSALQSELMNCATDRLEGRVAVVTGAAGEIGTAIVTTLLQAGASVIGVVRSKPAQPSPDRANGGDRRLLMVRADVRNEREVKRAVSLTLQQFGRIDILVNGAGARGPTAPVTKLSLKQWQEVVDTNLTGPFLFSRECLRHMAKQSEGRVINISSVVARWAYPLRASYAASKAALISLTLTLAQEAGPANVQVNAICPGPVQGNSLQGVLNARALALGISVEEMERQFMRPAALGRKVTPDDISRMVLFLCSDAARNVTGQVIDVSAGYGLYPGI